MKNHLGTIRRVVGFWACLVLAVLHSPWWWVGVGWFFIMEMIGQSKGKSRG